MKKLPLSVINFTANNEDRQEGYRRFVEYYNAYKAGKVRVYSNMKCTQNVKLFYK